MIHANHHSRCKLYIVFNASLLGISNIDTKRIKRKENSDSLSISSLNLLSNKQTIASQCHMQFSNAFNQKRNGIICYDQAFELESQFGLTVNAFDSISFEFASSFVIVVDSFCCCCYFHLSVVVPSRLIGW